MATLRYCHFLNGSNQCCWACSLVMLFAPEAWEWLITQHVYLWKCALLTSVQNSHSVIKSLLNMIPFSKYFILTSSKYQVSQCVLTITPRIVLLFCSRDQTTFCYLLRGWRVAPVLLRTPCFTPHNTWITCLATVRNKKKEKKHPVPPRHKRMQTVTCVGGCGWTQQQPLLHSRFVGWFCIHNCSAVPS